MKKITFYISTLAVIFLIWGCNKPKYITTPVTQMNATIGPYTFNTATVYPATETNVYHDSTVTLIITGENLTTREKIVLSIKKYIANKDSVYSVAAGSATATYIHIAGPTTSGTSIAIGGQITISNYSPDCILGGFNFTTADGIYVTKGTFSVPIPDYVAHPY